MQQSRFRLGDSAEILHQIRCMRRTLKPGLYNCYGERLIFVGDRAVPAGMNGVKRLA